MRNFAILLGLLLSTTMATAQKNYPGGEMNIQADEAATEPKEADEAPTERIADAPCTSTTFFVIDKAQKAFDKAQKACQSNGAELATVRSLEEQRLLMKFLKIQLKLGNIGTYENWYWLGSRGKYGSECGSACRVSANVAHLSVHNFGSRLCNTTWTWTMLPICVIKE